MTARPPDRQPARATDEPVVEREETAEERTDLAWTRSGLSLLAAFVVLARRVLVSDDGDIDPLTLGLAAAAGVGWAVGIAGTRLVARQRYGPGATVPPRHPWQLLSVTLGTVALAVAGLSVTFAYS
jgi:uncharacterized membrane protein YidH (DUF202 family)